MTQPQNIIATDASLVQIGLFASAATAVAMAVIELETKLTLDQKIRGAIDAIKAQVIEYKRYLAVAWSGGKDSSVTLNLTFTALRELKAEGHCLPMLFVAHSDTRMENPVIHSFNKQQIRQIRSYAKKAGIPTEVYVARPGLSNDYWVSVIGGRTIASVGAVSKCQQMVKSQPLSQLRSKIRKWVAQKEGVKPNQANIVSLIGTRRDESAVRAARMESRGESATAAVEAMSGSGELVLSPIADFTTMEIFEYLGRVRSGKIESYTADKFEALVDVYRDMNGGDCMVSAFIAQKETARPPCGNRTGCWGCTRVSADHSAEAMLTHEDQKFLWLKPLNDIRNYLMKRHYDPSARCWIGRTLGDDGQIDVKPNSYSPSFTLELLRLMLTAQRDEELAAEALGISPRFTILDEKQILAIDFLWGRYAYQNSFTALRTYVEIYEGGARYEVPSLDTIPKFTQADVAFRARAPFADHEYFWPTNGLQSLEHAVSDAMPLTTTNSGMIVSDVNVGEEFGFDEEGLAMFMDFERDYALKKYSFNTYPSSAVHYMLSYGMVHLYKGTHGELDRILRVSNQVWRHGLQPLLSDPQAILARLAEVMPASIYAQDEALSLPGTDNESDPRSATLNLTPQQQMFLFI
jgi:3'-phosphoadenosine 5'-phosphosulfate sulfotransferase (PAPS reductase)/FAD synthetase